MARGKHIPEEKINTLAEAFKSIGHPERIEIMNFICNCNEKRVTVKNIYTSLKMNQPNVSRHLSIMRRSGILKREQEGVNTYYYPDKENESVNSLMKVFDQLF